MSDNKSRIMTQKQRQISNAFEVKRNVKIIPAKKDIIENQNNKLHVAAYCRVSTFDDSQSGSFELQKQSYLEKINANPNWILAGIYADQGTSGTSTRKRTQFMKMIEDCRQGKIDLILVKSVSRFARNQLDFIGTSRELKSLPHPVGIYIEDINLNTLDTNSEFILGILAIVAQGESEQKSAAITWSIIERFKKGLPIIPTHNLLGYTKDEFGRVIIDKSESKVVKFIYDSYINGTSVTEIANQLMKRKISTVTGLERWSNSSIYHILRNEKYKGEVVMQKTFTVDCFSHKSRKNNGEKTQYILEHGIPSIISDKKWELTQKLLKYPNCKSKSTKVISMPRLYIKRIKSGKLRNYIVLDPSWKPKEIKEVFK
ncbi:recombinase family protein [Streptococcus iniae]|uniref:Recombinase family protein n=1 Tax=Streptococcus iniae TaxID=1346 RepID=A0A3L8GHP7_STRIN|nr:MULTISPECIES: recombinase family protein [Streptococcaceae]QIW56799.1 recombinase family protein [Lactococcus raffinolactis]RLU56103.1 recombinase family protein [Streptococcus iniae]RLU58765.1 recombinase family protein [Streptococcus iniae]